MSYNLNHFQQSSMFLYSDFKVPRSMSDIALVAEAIKFAYHTTFIFFWYWLRVRKILTYIDLKYISFALLKL